MRYLLFMLLICPFWAMAQLTLATVFSNHMLLQRGKPIVVWGTGLPAQEVDVFFMQQSRKIKVGEDSTWRVVFPKQAATTIPQQIVVSMGAESIEIADILIGDVWLCIGQSNMEWPMVKEKHWDSEVNAVAQPEIRFMNPFFAGRNVFGTPYTEDILKRLTPAGFYAWDGWQQPDVQTVQSLSAVGYYFAKAVHQQVQVPIGIINLSIGGAPLETFLDKEAMRLSPQFNNKVNSLWLNNEALPVWIRERATQQLGGATAPFGDEMGPNHAYKPGFAFEAGLLPLKHFPVKGVLVYQGESNAEEEDRVTEYADLFKLMVNNYRKFWNDKRMPFYWAQLSSVERNLWPLFRNMQRELLRDIKQGGMAVTSDIGLPHDVHPRDKKSVGERLARWALHLTYKVDVVPSGPLPLSAKYKKDKVVIRFKYANNGLRSADGSSLREFSVDGATEAEANLRGKKVEVRVGTKPAFVYYGWKPYSTANLVNQSLLPASTFKLRVR